MGPYGYVYSKVETMRTFKAFFLCAMVAALPALQAGTVRLTNNSPFRLRAVVRANDNTFLGEQIIGAQNNSTWDDGFQGLPGSLESQRSQTPYNVEWFCLDGSSFSLCTGVATGTTVTSTMCSGARQCRGKNRQQQPGVQPAPPIPVPVNPNQQQQYGQPQQPQQQQQGYYGQPPQQPPPPYPAPQREYQAPDYQSPGDTDYTQS